MVTHWFTRRLPKRGDDSGSLMFALLLIFLATALAGLMTPVLLISMNGTRADQRRVASLAAAEAGIDVAMGQIRAANDGTGSTGGFTTGVLSELPCGQLTGSVDAANNSRYQVTVSYYASDPRGQNSTWLTNNAIQCIPNAGVYSSPSYALLRVAGHRSGDRRLQHLQTRTRAGDLCLPVDQRQHLRRPDPRLQDLDQHRPVHRRRLGLAERGHERDDAALLDRQGPAELGLQHQPDDLVGLDADQRPAAGHVPGRRHARGGQPDPQGAAVHAR